MRRIDIVIILICIFRSPTLVLPFSAELPSDILYKLSALIHPLGLEVME
jgi:hypothetical protein